MIYPYNYSLFGIIPSQYFARGFIADCTGSQAKVLMTMLSHVNMKTGRMFPSIERVCDLSGLSRRSVQGGLRVLVERGALVKTGKRFRGRAVIYKLPTWAMIPTKIEGDPAVEAERGALSCSTGAQIEDAYLRIPEHRRGARDCALTENGTAKWNNETTQKYTEPTSHPRREAF